MSENKPYSEQPTKTHSANEAAALYESPAHSVDSFIASLPKDEMRSLIDFGIKEQCAGRCIPNAQVESLINERLGWE